VVTTGTTTITENIAILGHVARLYPEAGLLPDGDLERLARCYELLSLFAGGVHIAFAQIWRPERFLAGEAARAELEAGGRAKVLDWFAEIEGLLASSDYIDGRGYTLCDAYPLVFFRWGVRLGFDMSVYPSWNRHLAMMLARPAVARVMAREDIVIG
jgi:glutathione S-transferase